MYWAFYHEYPQEHATVRQRQISDFCWPATKHNFSDAWRTSSSPDWKAMPVRWRNDDFSMGRIWCIAITIQHQTSTEYFPGKNERKRKLSRKQKEQDPHLRDFHQQKLSELNSYQLVFVDESGCDKQIGCRQTGWSPLGMTPVQLSKFHRSERYQILPAYAQDDIILSRTFKGSANAAFFESLIEQLLQHCGRWPESQSVLVMDNASFHHSDRVKKLCSDMRVKLLYLPPNSPDFNPVGEFFAELKSYIKKAWPAYEKD